MNKISYKEYSAIVNVVFSEELQRLEEWIYSMTNGYDCSEENYWIKETPGADIPSLDELNTLMLALVWGDGEDIDLFSDDDLIVEETVDLIRSKWMSM
jgi:hypothetical protein